MANIPKISIVTPSYNQAEYIGATIESVLSQAGDFEIEYVVMDGGSTDASVEVIKRYADEVEAGTWPTKCAGISMQWVSQKDKGQSDAINQGLRRSTGDILSYINSDDLYCDGAFQTIATAFGANIDADFIYGDGDVIDETGGLQWEWLSRPYSQRVMTSYHFLWNDFTNYIMQQATFWRRSVHDWIGYFDESFHYAMDVEFWVRAGQARLNLRHVPAKLGQFRMIAGTKSLSSPTAFWEDYLEIYRRYRGSPRLAIFFAYYYYNVVRQFEFDSEPAIASAQQSFRRWAMLAPHERQLIGRKASQGLTVAVFMLANDLYQQQQYARAAVMFGRGLARYPLSALHPIALVYLLRHSLGPQRSRLLDRVIGRLIHQYRRRRYQYRYL